MGQIEGVRGVPADDKEPREWIFDTGGRGERDRTGDQYRRQSTGNQPRDMIVSVSLVKYDRQHQANDNGSRGERHGHAPAGEVDRGECYAKQELADHRAAPELQQPEPVGS